jgi:hypothetical protein
MSKTQIVTGGIADDAVSEEHIDATAITGTTALTVMEQEQLQLVKVIIVHQLQIVQVESTQLIGLPQLVQLVLIPHLLEEETEAGIIMMKE